MNVNSGGPHILLFERDQQLTTLLSSELAQAGYEVHTARTAVEVFDAIARFPVRLVMVDLAQAQAGRREFWVALDAQRRGRGVQVFTFRCTNLGGFGPDDPDERVETVLTDLEVDGPDGAVRLVEAVRARVPGSTVTSAPARPAASIVEASYQSARPAEPSLPPLPRQGSPVYQPLQQSSPVYQAPRQASPIHQSAPMQPAQQSSRYQSAPMPQVQAASAAQQAQPPQSSPRPQLPEVHAQPPAPARPAETPRVGHSTFTDKIRAVFYPSSQSFSAVPETNGSPYGSAGTAQHSAQYQSPEAQPRPRASQRFAEAEYPAQNVRDEMVYQAPPVTPPAAAPAQSYTNYAGFSAHSASPVAEESGLDQLTRMLRESQPAGPGPIARPGAGQEVPEFQDLRPQNPVMHGNVQSPAARPGLTIDPQEIQEFRSQIMQAARMDEAHERVNSGPSRVLDAPAGNVQLRASPIQDIPFEQEVAHRRGLLGNTLPQVNETQARPAMTVMQPTQIIQQMPQQTQAALADAPTLAGSGAQLRAAAPVEESASLSGSAQFSPLSPLREASPQNFQGDRQASGPLSLDGEVGLPEHVRASLQQTISRRPEVRTTDDTLLDIVKSLPPMNPAAQPPVPQPQVLNGRATRSLGSVLLEGHLVPQERLQVAQHVQRMMRGVDLNYQLGEILLMFKLLTPDQLLAASLVSYGMISTIQISSLGRIRQELYTMGLEYDLESLLVLFRILTPEQLREVRASWSS
ncbi:MAG TPA: hypothetical protein VGD98_03675 [Ktedonobacteraceae bacterium]